MQPTSIRLPPELDEWLKNQATAEDRSVSYVVVRELRAAMARDRKRTARVRRTA